MSGKTQRNLKRKSHVISCRQGNDRGTQYRSGIYYHTEDQKEVALNFIKEIQPKYKDRIVVEVLKADK